MSLFFCLVIFGLIGMADAQIFTEAVGGPGFDCAASMTQPKEGEPFAVAGPWDYNGIFDAFIAKFNRSGSIKWAKGLGDGSTGGNGIDTAASVVETSDGGFVMTGETCLGTGGDGDLLIAKFNSDGAFEWATAFGGNGWDRGLSVIETQDGGFVVTGVTTSFGASGWDLFLVKFNSAGTFQWAKRLGKSGKEVGSSVIEVDTALYVAGWTTSFDSMDILLAKFDKNGNLGWAKAFGGSDNEAVESLFGGKTGDWSWSGLSVAGWTDSFGADDQDFLVARFDENGNLDWAKTLGGTSRDNARSLVGTMPHLLCPPQLVVTGSTWSFDAGDQDVLLAAFDFADGSFKWARTFGDPSHGEAGFSVKQALIELEYDSFSLKFPGGRLLVAGSYTWGPSPQDILLATFDPYGDSCSLVNVIQPTVTNISSSLSTPTGSFSSADLQVIASPTLTDIDQDKTYTLTPSTTSICNPPLVEYTDVGPTGKPVVFSFAIIADNHINVPKLEEVVDWINDNKDAEDIRFAIHVGDLTDETDPDGSGSQLRYSLRPDCLLGVKQELDRLEVPYTPLIGNHDVWYDNNDGTTPPDPTPDGRPEEIFNQVFSPEYDYLGSCVLPNWIKAPTPILAQPPNAWPPQPVENYFQNFAFDYMRYHFICLDWVSRDDVYTSDYSDYNRGWPDLQIWASGGTWDWFTDYLSSHGGFIGAEYENMLLFAHHPLSFCDGGLSDCGRFDPCLPIAFNTRQYNEIVSHFANNNYHFNIDKWFAGHVHIPLEENITDNTVNNQGNHILDTVITASVSPWAPPPLHQNPYAPALKIVRVHDDINVNFTYLPSNPTINSMITFTGSGSSSNPIGCWDWDFGDGNTGSGQTTTHPYPDPGIYKVTLTITDSLAVKARIAKAIDVGTTQLTSDYPGATAYNNARRLIFDQNGVLHLVYTTGPGPGMLTYAKSTDQGNTWFEVTPNLLWGGHPALDVDISDKPCVVENWAGFGSGFDAKRREKTLGWFSYDGVSDLNAVFGYASMVIDSDDTLHVAISYDDGTASEIRYYYASPGGRISDPEVVVSTTEECSFASIALDYSENPHVIWQQDEKIYHSKRDGFWSLPVEISVPPCINSYHPSIVTGTSGNIYAVWEGNYQSGPAIGKAVWFSMYNGGWSTPESVSGVSIVAESYPQVVYKDGLLCVVWSDFTGSTHDVYYSSKKGTDPWSLPVDLSNTPLKESKFPQAAICSVSPNELCVVWTEENSYDIQSRYFSFTKTATESGTAHFSTDNGNIQNLTAVPEAALPSEGKPNLQFPHGFFSFNITGLTTGQTVNVTIILPEDMPKITQYWKYHTPEGWYQIPLGSNDGDNIITVQLTDGGTGDDDGDANGVIVDQGGPGTPLKITETMYKNSITQPIDVSKIRYKFTAVDEEWAAKWTNEILYVQKETKYSIAVYLNETGYVTRVDFERWGFSITEIPYGLAVQSLANLPPRDP